MSDVSLWFFSGLTLFHFVCSISPNFSLIFFFFLHFLKLCQSFLVTSPHLSLTYLKLLSLCPPLFGGHYLSFTSMPYCSFSFCPFFSPPFVGICPSLFPCPVSSDLYKSLQSGSQVALPPHLQLAFSGKIWPTLKACSIYSLPCLPFLLFKCLVFFVLGCPFLSGPVLCSFVGGSMPFFYVVILAVVQSLECSSVCRCFSLTF